MKKFVLDKSISIIQKKYPEYDDKKLAAIRYGLEGTYLTITKAIIIFIIAYFIGILKELIILLLLFNIIRSVSFGLHAKNSIVCLISSTIIFIGCPLICKYLVIADTLKIIISIPIIILIAIFSPADTEKRPIISKKRRLVYKILSTIISIIYMVLNIYIKINFICNALIISLLIQIFLINPISYKLFGVSYNNYKRYHKKSG